MQSLFCFCVVHGNPGKQESVSAGDARPLGGRCHEVEIARTSPCRDKLGGELKEAVGTLYIKAKPGSVMAVTTGRPPHLIGPGPHTAQATVAPHQQQVGNFENRRLAKISTL